MSSNEIRTLAGRCYCGDVGYEVSDSFEYAGYCHCANCRRTTGAASKPFAGIGWEKFRLTRGAEALLIVGDSDGHDAHCRRCGSLLYSRVRDGAYAHVAMGTLADTPTIRPQFHIFVGSKAEWEIMGDGLPQYEGHVTEGG